MSKVAEYLKDHLRGDVSIAPLKSQHFSGDASGLCQLPQIVISPYDVQDVRKVTRFSWQLAERGRVLPIVSRGAGTDLSGAAIGQAIVLSTQAHLNKILEFNDKHGMVEVEPGANFGKLQHMLTFSHGCYIPAYPSSFAYSTIGGAIANNSGGERSLQSGPMLNFVESLQVVLANGDVIETGRITKKEVSRKMGLSTFEGEIYRAVDGLISENHEVISAMDVPSRGGVGYNLKSVRADNGSMDLTPLFVGSQGTLGVITKATLSTEKYKPGVSLLVLTLRDRAILGDLITEINVSKPLNLECIDSSMLQLARRDHPKFLVEELGSELPAGVFIAELSEMSKRSLVKLSKKFTKKFADMGVNVVEHDKDVEYVADKLKNLPSTLLTQQFGATKLVAGIDDAMVAPGAVHDFLQSAENLFKKLAVSVAVHARIGEGIIHAYPLIDLTQLGDRQKLLRLEQDYYKLVMDQGGSVVGEHGAGRTRGVFANVQLGDVVYGLMHRIKQIFDPYGILNPGVKVDVDQKAMLGLLSANHEISQLYH